jgi:hypothetical protein
MGKDNVGIWFVEYFRPIFLFSLQFSHFLIVISYSTLTFLIPYNLSFTT